MFPKIHVPVAAVAGCILWLLFPLAAEGLQATGGRVVGTLVDANGNALRNGDILLSTAFVLERD